jgi:hypothetical protein
LDPGIKSDFAKKWKKYFPGAELPLVFFYTDRIPEEPVHVPEGWHCLICDLLVARQGDPLYFTADTVGCGGGKRYLGFSPDVRPDFRYFLSCGIPGRLEGERYKSSPELVGKMMENYPAFTAPAEYIVFKRWDKIEKDDRPLAVVFFARADVLSGLFTLANFDQETPDGVISPFAPGCGAVVQFPYLEGRSDHPRAVLGLFDVSARPCVNPEVLTFAAPWPKFVSMLANMDESFLITAAWEKVRTRMKRGS